MKAVMLSIKPKWCELIANGKKTIEVRKTKPNIETPFKCYIYCTIGVGDLYSVNGNVQKVNQIEIDLTKDTVIEQINGKVIGEFLCDDILPTGVGKNGSVVNYHFSYRVLSCLGVDEIRNYIGKGNIGYGWHISNLKIYDKPKELCEFVKPCIFGEESERPCFSCFKSGYATHMHIDCFNIFTRPPRSWCYVEELDG